MKFSLFRSGWGPRAAAAVAFAILAFGTVAVITRHETTPSKDKTQTGQSDVVQAELVAVHLIIDAVRPVGQWTIRNGDEIIGSTAADATSWESEFRCAAVDLSIVTTTPADVTANALRIRIETKTRRGDFTFWCPGDCAIAVAADDIPLTASAFPTR